MVPAPKVRAPRKGGHVLKTMIQRNRAPAPRQPTPPGGELRFHRTDKKVTEGRPSVATPGCYCFGALSLVIKAVQTPEGRLPLVGTARLSPVFEQLPLNNQSSDGWREKALSWLKISPMVSNK